MSYGALAAPLTTRRAVFQGDEDDLPTDPVLALRSARRRRTRVAPSTRAARAPARVRRSPRSPPSRSSSRSRARARGRADDRVFDTWARETDVARAGATSEPRRRSLAALAGHPVPTHAPHPHPTTVTKHDSNRSWDVPHPTHDHEARRRAAADAEPTSD